MARLRERPVGNQGIDETRSAEAERWIGELMPDRILGDVFLGFRFQVFLYVFVGLKETPNAGFA